MIDLVSIQSRSLQAKREAVKLLSDHADPDALTETVKLLADPAPDIALAEAIKPLAEHAAKELDAEKLLGEAIGILAGSCDFGEQLREVLKRLAQHADTEQLRAAILACVGAPYQLEAAIAAYEEAEEPDDVKPLRVVG